MKITKRQLRRIIKEEKLKLLEEPKYTAPGHVMDKLHSAIDALIEAMGNEQALMELQGIVDEWDTETYGVPTRGDIFTNERK
jgi:hypothetical protein